MKIIGMGRKKVQETVVKGNLVLGRDMSYQGNLVVEGSISGTCGSRSPGITTVLLLSFCPCQLFSYN